MKLNCVEQRSLGKAGLITVEHKTECFLTVRQKIDGIAYSR